MAKIFALIFILYFLGNEVCANSRIHADLASKLDAKHEGLNVIITIVNGTDSVFKKLSKQKFANRGARITAVAEALEDYAEECQQFIHPIIATTQQDVKIEKFWISNQVFISGASSVLIRAIAESRSVQEIREEQIFTLEKPLRVIKHPNASRENVGKVNEPSIKLIGAPDVWKLGNRGEGIIIGSIDSGALHTHEALRNNFVGVNYGWFDPALHRLTPRDRTGHGTHTIGTIAGELGIGVAPKAKWMSCRGCWDGSCPESHLKKCAQFMVCPTLPSGQNKDCTKAPHIVSNSWGGNQGKDFFDSFIRAFHAAGIIPVFSIGNSGPECKTANSPGDSKAGVISVGATALDDSLADFSSVGPSVLGDIQPKITAPGVRIRSAFNTGNHDYATLDGTSMACPHVSGSIALLLSKTPHLSFERVEEYLYSNAVQTGLKPTGKNCGGKSESKFPNNAFGNGRLNVLASVSKLTTCQANS